MVWVPISLISLGMVAARAGMSVVHGRLPARLAVWSVLRPRRYDARVTASLFEAVNAQEAAVLQS
jgi:hypothetical protein